MDVAIVGIACRFPGGAETPEQFWELLCSGGDAITELPAGRFDVESVFDPDPGKPGKLYARWGGFLERIDAFDADFFGISPREARRIDPQQRLLLEVAWEALEDAGRPADALAGSGAGVFVGISTNDYGSIQFQPRNAHLIDAHAPAGGALCIAANRLSYCLDLHGPSLAVDTACSSSLTALHLARLSLERGECELAIVAGVNVLLSPEVTIGFCKASMLSPDGRCRPFDAGANGYVRSEGAGAVVLEPLTLALENRDPVRAVIRATAVNQDGRTAGISVPNAAAQKVLMRSALREAGVAPREVQYVEAHGTGTAAGDPREADAIGSVLGEGRAPGTPCLIGSVKGNIGHLESAAGIAGLIKTALALERRRIPPSLHFAEPSPAIPFEELLLRVVTEPEEWPAPPGRAVAGVNSFGFGGANAHAILAEPPPRPAPVDDGEGDGTARILTISARAPGALRELAHAYAALLDGDDGCSTRDVCYTAAVRRSHHEHRLAIVGRTRSELARGLAAHLAGAEPAEAAAGRHTKGLEPRLAFVFSGMGPQWPGMGRQLLDQEPEFRRTLEECDRLLRPLAGWSLLDELAADEPDSRIAEADRAHVANLALQLGLAALLRSWGVVPDAVVGHSSGEMAAACVAGALPLEDAVRLAFHRGRLQHAATGSGGMIAAGVSADEAAGLIRGDERRVSLAAVNGPSSVTLSGELDALDRIAELLERRGRFCRRLPVRVPYHGPQMEPLREQLLEALSGLDARPPAIPVLSTVTGGWADGRAFDVRYWWENVRRPVLFGPAVERLAADGFDLFVELSPHPVLAPSMHESLHGHDGEPAVLPTLRRNDDERRTLLRTLATLYARGRGVDWRGVFDGGDCVRLPSYPWQRERHWFEPAPGAGDEQPQRSAGVDSGHPLLGRRLHAARPTWEADLGDPRLAWLDDHVLAGTATFPGAAYVETALAAARALGGDGPSTLEDVEFRRLLPRPREDERILQCSVDERSGLIEIHSATADGRVPWTLHATARLAEGRAEPECLDLDAARERCATPVDVDAFYGAAARRGLRYDGAFRGIAELRNGGRESLARIAAPAGTGVAADAYGVQPGLLDSAFQSLVAAQAANGWDDLPARAQVVLARLGRVEARRAAGSGFWCRASVDRVDRGVIRGRVEIVDDEGRAVLTCHGLELRVLDERGGGAAELMCEEVWEPIPPRVGAPAPAELAAAVEPTLDRLAADAGFGDYYSTVEPALNAIAARSIRAALDTLGRDGRREVAAGGKPLGVVARHRRLLERLLAVASAADGSPEPDEAALAGRDDVRSALRLVRESGGRLAATLRGEDDARGWLVVGEASDALTEFYSRTPWGLFYNHALAELVAAARPPGRKLRILEVGAGTGATTAAILERLPDGIGEYVFTDVSPFFVKRARDRFRPPPALHFEVLDIEREPPTPRPGFDIVVAADVVHATADVRATLGHLRRLLEPGGLLVLLELTRRSPWLDLVFGQLEGWWRFADRELRPSHPLLGAEAWREALEDAGFTGIAQLADAADGLGPAQTIMVAQTAAALEPGAAARHWLVLGDRGGVGRRAAAALRREGDRCTVVRPASAYRRRGPDRIDLTPTDVEHWRRLLRELGAADAPPLGLLHLWSLDAPPLGALSTPTLMGSQDVSCGSVVALMQATQGGRGFGDVWLVTSGGQWVGADDRRPNLAQSPLWGLGRVLRNELSGKRCRLVDLGADRGPEEVEALVDELRSAAAEGEHELALRGTIRYARRLRRAALAPPAAPGAGRRSVPPTSPFRLEVGSPGALETLALREAERARPRTGEVAIRVAATALNFRDVLTALGLMGETAGAGREPLGLECSGVVTAADGSSGLRPGDEVLALASGAFASEIVTRADLVARKPGGLTFAEAATVPSAFVTAYHALHRLARIAEGDRVLIHAASGGVGLAALQLCRRAGAHVFATAGTPEKRAYLESLGVEYVMDSRSLAFADEVLEQTGGEGVDIVLNSLAGEARMKGLALLRPSGRFVDMAVRDMLRDVPLRLGPFERGLSFFSLGDVTPAARPEMGEVLRRVAADVAAGTLAPLPHTDFDFSDASGAFRLMAQAGHIGKVVLTLGAPRYDVERPVQTLLRGDATYLVTGGLGGFALAVARGLVQRGARHLVLLSRSGAPRDEDAAALQELVRSPARIVVMRADVADEAALDAALREIRATMPPLRGVLHAAMTLDDDLLGRMDGRRFRAVLAPKVAGGWNLHTLTRDDDLDLFVLFSSGSSLIGIPAQANYAAANAFLDALAVHRRALGLPALAVNWGAIRGVGYVARHPELEGRLSWEGIDGIGPDDACAALEEALRHDLGRVAVARIDWSRWTDGRVPGAPDGEPSTRAPAGNGDRGALLGELAAAPPEARRELLEHHLVRVAASVLDAAPERVDPERPVTEMGLDSLMAVELQTAVRRQLGVEVSLVEVLEGMTVRQLADGVLEQVSHDGARV
jgi:acyl transferase domain-containing protein/NADPH:quinone reductase-like Zn-dependent oxidoreductase/SAM-dependent methyltransferase/acyl carrier protein